MLFGLRPPVFYIMFCSALVDVQFISGLWMPSVRFVLPWRRWPNTVVFGLFYLCSFTNPTPNLDLQMFEGSLYRTTSLLTVS